MTKINKKLTVKNVMSTGSTAQGINFDCDDLTQVLNKKYRVLCCIDLSEITTSPNKIYQILDQHFKTAFKPNERIVFYSQFQPSNSLIAHIIQAALLIDISNSFILLCCSANITEKVKYMCNMFGFTKDIIQTEQIAVKSLPLLDNFTLPDTVCPMPWTHLEVDSKANIKPCCVSTEIVGNINHDKLIDVFANQQMRSLRDTFLKGGKPQGCNKCWQLEDKNLISNRMRHKDLLLKNILVDGLDKIKLQIIDLKFGITCNFKCRICSPSNSSLHAEEAANVKNIEFAIPKNWAENPSNLEQIEKLLPTLTSIDMYGGEPFLLKSFSKVLELAVSQDYAENIRLHYNTNGSVYPTNLIKYWRHFREVDIYFSIDNVGKKFELERGGSWDEVEKNILKIKNLGLPNVKLSIMPAVSVMNIFYIDSILEWAHQHQLAVNPLYVTSPNGYALTQLTKKAKEMLVEKYRNHLWPEMANLLESIIKNPDSNGAEFIKLTKYYDTVRNENFAETHPEIAFAMGYNI